ncbi:hypothetical protein CAPTEDRAFT_214094 [Capitella teleta]|uniref:Uncharacterized protein n=1 Tax=Capitella teleta TaxID=283909 RepID=R7TK80_CAPTE|nr:hypothetical protein CAPTEDRAFT_214094 [Capitella teleta]|eukprot:ELT94119.1 hypothetical protein CAPTEDRAFT_214094 [Capitella teleta]
MDDIFGLLHSKMDPERQLLAAVSAGLQDTLTSLIERGEVDLNAELQRKNGNTALHIACERGFHGCARRLIQAGADVDKPNKFGFTPLILALRHSRECLREILDRATSYPDLFIIWTAEHKKKLPLWSCFSPEIMVLLLLATPNLAAIGDGKMPERVNEHFLMKPLPSGCPLLKTFFATGNRLPAKSMDKLANSLSASDRDLVKKKSQSVPSLQFSALLAVRRSMNCNVYHGAKSLPIPKKLRESLTDCADFD